MFDSVFVTVMVVGQDLGWRSHENKIIWGILGITCTFYH